MVTGVLIATLAIITNYLKNNLKIATRNLNLVFSEDQAILKERLQFKSLLSNIPYILIPILLIYFFKNEEKSWWLEILYNLIIILPITLAANSIVRALFGYIKIDRSKNVIVTKMNIIELIKPKTFPFNSITTISFKKEINHIEDAHDGVTTSKMICIDMIGKNKTNSHLIISNIYCEKHELYLKERRIIDDMENTLNRFIRDKRIN